MSMLLKQGSRANQSIEAVRVAARTVYLKRALFSGRVSCSKNMDAREQEASRATLHEVCAKALVAVVLSVNPSDEQRR